jgi:hypothetical protein
MLVIAFPQRHHSKARREIGETLGAFPPLLGEWCQAEVRPGVRASVNHFVSAFPLVAVRKDRFSLLLHIISVKSVNSENASPAPRSDADIAHPLAPPALKLPGALAGRSADFPVCGSRERQAELRLPVPCSDSRFNVLSVQHLNISKYIRRL